MRGTGKRAEAASVDLRYPGFEGKASLAGRRWVWQACHRQWSRDGAGGMSWDAGSQLENNQEEQERSSSSAQNVFREVFDERSEPSETGESRCVRQRGEDP